MLLDSNIIIYAAKPEHSELREFIREHDPLVSAVSYVEVLGYHQLSEQERAYFEEFFEATCLLAVSREITRKAVELRQQRKMTLGDALVSATAIVHELTLVTRNTKDFDWIDGLKLYDPLESTV